MAEAVRKPERRLSVLAVSRGIGIGRVVFLHGEKLKFFRIDIELSEIETEVKRLDTAVRICRDQLAELAAHDESDPHKPVSSIFGVHLLIVEESSLVSKVEAAIREEQVNAEWALKVVSDNYLEKQISIADPHLQEKHLDIDDVVGRIHTALNGAPSRSQLAYNGAVVVAREMHPSAIMELTKSRPAAVITERGGWTSHTSILAREFNLPMVSGVKDLEQTFSHGDTVIVDGIDGHVIFDPSPESLEQYRTLANHGHDSAESRSFSGKSPVTLDGTPIVIQANVDTPEAYRAANRIGADGIGLFRSESLLSRSGIVASEDEQTAAYSQMAEAAGDAGIKIRTFDISADQLKSESSLVERNPSLGLRSIRLSLSDETFFRTQIRAILRASAENKVDIVLPMISGVGEIIRSRSIIDEERAHLLSEGIAFGGTKLGAMIEVPSAVMTAHEIAARVDFLCLGTNDLVQYLLAVDRDNDAVAELYQSLHPAVIRAIGEVVTAAQTADIPLVVCGEMAGSPFYVPLLIGLGVRQFSMNVNSVRQVSNLISGITVDACSGLIESIKSCETAEEIEGQLRSYYAGNWSELFPPGLLDAKHR